MAESNPAGQSVFYRGIDFANRLENEGQCVICDNGQTLTALDNMPNGVLPKRIAVDCPLGTSIGFQLLLAGEFPNDNADDGFKSRATERQLRIVAGEYTIQHHWQDRADHELFGDEMQGGHPHRRPLFHPTAHIKDTLGLCIVPECLHWLGVSLAPNAALNERLNVLQEARRGEAQIVEAHPRMFLYSVLEAICAALENLGQQAFLNTLNAARRYKKATEFRVLLRNTIIQNIGWMGPQNQRAFAFDVDVTQDDHLFDAWLCSLTAWAHERGLTLRWDEARINEDHVNIEGHILVLRQPTRNERPHNEALKSAEPLIENPLNENSHRRTCPAGCGKIFARWPWGTDAHAKSQNARRKCCGIPSHIRDPQERWDWYRRRFLGG